MSYQQDEDIENPRDESEDNQAKVGSAGHSMLTPQNQLITITLDTYKASRINSMISSLRMRIEPIEHYLNECQKKETKNRKEQ
jgi:hypothetical protein